MLKIINASDQYACFVVIFCHFRFSALQNVLASSKNHYLSTVKWVYLPVWLMVLGTMSSGYLFSQSVVQPKQLDYSSMGVLYNTEKVFEIRPHINGGAVSMQFGKIKTFYKTHYYQFDIGYLKHPKEKRQTVTFNTGNPFATTTNSYTYGKQNHFMILRGGIGKKIYYSEKAKRKGVAVGINYELGPSIGILNPYYLKLTRLKENGRDDYVSTERYSEENKNIFLDNSRIVGSASFFKGFGHLSFLPGVHARIGAHFSLGAFDKYVKAFEIGIMADAFFQRVPIMIIDNNSPVFFNGFISFQFGKRQ